MKSPLFSIVIPTLNEEQDLEDILRSIKAQTYRNKEITIVDGGSSDKTVEIAKRYTKKVYVLPRAGVTKSRNYGAKMSKGEIIQFMDADAVLLDEKYMENVVAAFDKYKVDVVVNRTDAYPPKTLVARAHKAYRRTNWEAKQKDVVLNAGPPDISFTCYKKKFFWKLGGYDENLIGNDEVDLSRRAKEAGAKTVFDPNIVIYHKDPYSLDQVKRQVRWYAKVLKKHETPWKKFRVLGYFALFPAYLVALLGLAVTLNIMALLFALIVPFLILTYLSKDLIAAAILLPLDLFRAFYFFKYYIEFHASSSRAD